MKQVHLVLAMCGCLMLAVQPAAADPATGSPKVVKKDKAADGEKTPDSPELAAARKRLKDAQAAMDKFQKEKKARSKVKPKWYKDADKAFAEAKKHNLPVWCVYSDPPTCGVCQKFEKEIINSGPVKNAKGAYIGYISNTPLPEYKCTAKPFGYLFTPDKQPIIPLPYMSSKPAKGYAERLQEYSAKLIEKQEKQVTRELEYAKKLVAALAAGEPAPEEEPDEDEAEEQPQNPAMRPGYGPNMPPRRPMPQYDDEEEDSDTF
ncbi:MAG: hypothetical protein Q3986_02415 [Akkermansia sp.]|nr:hypothetical protein [Akkermansia sp.]